MTDPTPIDLDKGGLLPQVHRTYLGPSIGWIETDEPTDIEFIVTAPGPLSTGMKGYLVIPEWLTVRSWVLLSTIAGSISFDIWKVAMTTFLAGTPPMSSDSIVGSNPPTLTNQVAASSSSLTSWNTTINQNDVLAFNIQSCAGVSRATLILRCIRNFGQPYSVRVP